MLGDLAAIERRAELVQLREQAIRTGARERPAVVLGFLALRGPSMD